MLLSVAVIVAGSGLSRNGTTLCRVHVFALRLWVYKIALDLSRVVVVRVNKRELLYTLNINSEAGGAGKGVTIL